MSSKYTVTFDGPGARTSHTFMADRVNITSGGDLLLLEALGGQLAGTETDFRIVRGFSARTRWVFEEARKNNG